MSAATDGNAMAFLRLARACLPTAPAPKAGPKDCCADFARVIECDGQTDTWECPFCGTTWSVPCR